MKKLLFELVIPVAAIFLLCITVNFVGVETGVYGWINNRNLTGALNSIVSVAIFFIIKYVFERRIRS
ncbi:hypothetical protein AB4851_00800 [Burkholderia sp. 22PA0099]|uniref:hypothetical protein n=1 Tax=Burkholderia sp. 22PA0099 TaxID=3237372 RepID=UPI0039C0D404